MIGEISGDFLQWLRGFYFVAEEGNARKASIAMGRVKSTISRQIRCLEKELGVTLFDRTAGRMVITPEGQKLRERAFGLFEYIQQMTDEVKNGEPDYLGKIVIATTHVIIDSILPPYVENFLKLHPQVTFQFEEGVLEKIYEKIESGEVDFGITFFVAGYRTLVYHALYETGLVLIAAKNNPYFSRRTIPTLKQIAEVPLILLTQRTSVSTLLKERFAQDHLKLHVIMRHNNFATIKKYVARGMGVAILGGNAISEEDEKYFDIYNLDRYFPKRTYGIVLNRKKYLSAVAKEFIRTIKPDIDFTAPFRPSEAVPLLLLDEFLQRGSKMNHSAAQADARITRKKT
jgi:DNA-binding transcriptional LysR family regulator